MIKINRVSVMTHSGQGATVTTTKTVRIFPFSRKEKPDVVVKVEKLTQTPPARWVSHFEFNWK